MINSPRIQEICGQVTSKVIAEIGCDHAYITKNLLDSGKIKFAYLTDISSKCLEKAKQNLKDYNTKTFFATGDGLKALNVLTKLRQEEKFNNIPCPLMTLKNRDAVEKNIIKARSTKSSYPKIEQVIIAGMGGFEIIKILNTEEAGKYNNFILQPQKNVVKVRKYLQNNGFKIVRDEIAQEDKMFYFILNAVRTKLPTPINTFELYFGFPKNTQTFKNYLNFKLQKCLEISSKTKTIENETLIRLIKEYLENLN